MDGFNVVICLFLIVVVSYLSVLSDLELLFECSKSYRYLCRHLSQHRCGFVFGSGPFL